MTVPVMLTCSGRERYKSFDPFYASRMSPKVQMIHGTVVCFIKCFDSFLSSAGVLGSVRNTGGGGGRTEEGCV